MQPPPSSAPLPGFSGTPHTHRPNRFLLVYAWLFPLRRSEQSIEPPGSVLHTTSGFLVAIDIPRPPCFKIKRRRTLSSFRTAYSILVSGCFSLRHSSIARMFTCSSLSRPVACHKVRLPLSERLSHVISFFGGTTGPVSTRAAWHPLRAIFCSHHSRSLSWYCFPPGHIASYLVSSHSSDCSLQAIRLCVALRRCCRSRDYCSTVACFARSPYSHAHFLSAPGGVLLALHWSCLSTSNESPIPLLSAATAKLRQGPNIWCVITRVSSFAPRVPLHGASLLTVFLPRRNNPRYLCRVVFLTRCGPLPSTISLRPRFERRSSCFPLVLCLS